jgi:hypothetical protein
LDARSGADERTTERVVAEKRSLEKILRRHVRVLRCSRDVVQHHLALDLEIGCRKPWAGKHVCEQFDALAGALRTERDVERGEVLRCVAVHARSEAFGRAVHLPLTLIRSAAPKEHVLDEMRQSVLAGCFAASAGVERDERGECARSGSVYRVQREPVRERLARDAVFSRLGLTQQ